MSSPKKICPACDAVFSLPPEAVRIGRVKCPKCGEKITFEPPETETSAPENNFEEFADELEPKRPSKVQTSRPKSTSGYHRRTDRTADGSKKKILVLAGVGGILLLGLVAALIFVLTDKPSPGPVAKGEPEKSKPVGTTVPSTKDSRPPKNTPKSKQPVPKEEEPPPEEKLTAKTMASLKTSVVQVRSKLDADEFSASGFVDRSSQLVVTSARALGLLDPAKTPGASVTISPATTDKPIKASIVNVDLDTELAVLRPEAAFPAGTGIEPNRLGVRDSQKLFVCGPATGELKTTSTIATKIVASPENELVRFDLNDSIESGLLGGAIVDADGKLVGVAVGAKQANAVPFAIPAERVTSLFNGQVESIEIGDAKQMGENRRVAVRVKVRDPFKKIKAVHIDWWFAVAGTKLPRSRTEPATLAKRQRVALSAASPQAEATGEIAFGKPNAGLQLWVQPYLEFEDGSGSYEPSQSKAVISAAPTSFTLKYQPDKGDKDAFTWTHTALRWNSGGSDHSLYSTNGMRMIESWGAANKDKYPLREWVQNVDAYAYLDEKPLPLDWKLNEEPGMTHFDVLDEIDFRGRSTNQKASFSRPQTPVSVAQAAHFVSSLGALNVPLPEGEVKVGDTWKHSLPIAISLLDKFQKGMLELTYRYDSTVVYNYARCLKLTISGTLRGTPMRDPKLSGEVKGVAMVDSRTGVTLRAWLSMDVSLALELKTGTVQAKGTTEAVIRRYCAIGSVAPPTPEEEGKAAILGRWELVRSESEGQSKDQTMGKKPILAVFDSGSHAEGPGTFFSLGGGSPYRLHPYGRTNTFILHEKEGFLDHIYWTIYRVEGDKLLTCSIDKENVVPKDFKTSPGSSLRVREYRRYRGEDRPIVPGNPIPPLKPKEKE